MKNILIIGIVFLTLGSCSSQWHLQKFYKKGGKLETIERVITVRDTIKGKDGKDSIIERFITLNCPEPVPPVTRWIVRFDNKRFKDSLKFIRSIYLDSLRYNNRSQKNDIKKHISDNRKDVKIQKFEFRKYRTVFLILIFLILLLLIIFYIKHSYANRR